jgi:hypothetical protein
MIFLANPSSSLDRRLLDNLTRLLLVSSGGSVSRIQVILRKDQVSFHN